MRIVVTGPESSGKSTLTKHLAECFNLPFAPEFARVHLEENGPEYTFETLGKMAIAHLEWQQQFVPAEAPLALYDSDLTNYKIWAEVVFGKCHPAILKHLPQEQDHRYLLCRPDLPWEKDPLRENPNDRESLFEMHQTLLNDLNRPFRIVEGHGKARLHCAKQAFQELTSD